MYRLENMLNLGIQKNMSYTDKKVVRLLNIIAITGGTTTLLFMFINIFSGYKTSVIILELVLGVALFSVLLLNYYGHFRVGKLLFFVSLHVILPLFTFWLEKGKHQEYIHFVVVMLLFMVYNATIWFYLLYFLNLALFYSPQLFLEVYPPENFSYQYPLVLFFSLFVVSKFFSDEQDRHEKLLNERNTHLARLNSEKNRLINIVSHDLRSPLNNIKSLIPLLNGGDDLKDYEHAHFLQMVDESVERMSMMINRTLDVNAIESNRINIKMEKCDIGLTLVNTAQSFANVFQKKNVELKTNVQLNKHYAFVDKNYLVQVVENILSNAIKFSEPEKQVLLDISQNNGKQQIMIKDEGPGFSAEDKKLMFGEFQKLSAKPTAKENSTGLGLSIVKKYVEAMNGDIWCESEQGHGSTFFLGFDTVHVN